MLNQETITDYFPGGTGIALKESDLLEIIFPKKEVIKNGR